jgi:hypothetical protein
MAKWLVLLGLVAASVALGYGYLGPESCQGCHPDAYAAWRASPHARAKESLSAAQQKDARCLSCHSPADGEQQVANVSCESCHGGGQYYSARYVMKDPELARLVGLVDPSEKGCRTCHDGSSPSLKPFDFVTKLKAIDHWSVERKKREEGGSEKAADKPADSSKDKGEKK